MAPPYYAWEDVFIRRLFISNNFATSVALAQVCVLLSVFLFAQFNNKICHYSVQIRWRMPNMCVPACMEPACMDCRPTLRTLCVCREYF